MYRLPSTSHRYAPSPRSTTIGSPPTAPNARAGLFTPPGMSCLARGEKCVAVSRFMGRRDSCRDRESRGTRPPLELIGSRVCASASATTSAAQAFVAVAVRRSPRTSALASREVRFRASLSAAASRLAECGNCRVRVISATSARELSQLALGELDALLVGDASLLRLDASPVPYRSTSDWSMSIAPRPATVCAVFTALAGTAAPTGSSDGSAMPPRAWRCSCRSHLVELDLAR